MRVWGRKEHRYILFGHAQFPRISGNSESSGQYNVASVIVSFVHCTILLKMMVTLQGFNEVVLKVCLQWCWKEIHSVEDRERTWKQGYQVASHCCMPNCK